MARRVWVAPGGCRREAPHARPHLQSLSSAADLQRLGRSDSFCARKGNNKRLEGPVLSRRFLFAYVYKQNRSIREVTRRAAKSRESMASCEIYCEACNRDSTELLQCLH